MTEPTFRSDMKVELIDFMGGDGRLAQAARVSTQGSATKEDAEAKGLINYLISSRHGSPVEHSVYTFYVEAPIFVFREFQRHRIASYNETSGRYRKLDPDFWVPDENRPLVNVGGSARPEFEEGTEEQRRGLCANMRASYAVAWDVYEQAIDSGVANEVARSVLPVGTYSQMFVTMNARSLMNFLSLRVDSSDSEVRSRPQAEIQAVAEQMETIFSETMPLTHASFVASGRKSV